MLLTGLMRRVYQLKTEVDGRMFPVTDSSKTIVDCFVREASRHEDTNRNRSGEFPVVD